MANVIRNDDIRFALVRLTLVEPVDTTGPGKDQADQVPAKVTEEAVPCSFLDRHLTMSNLANSFACRLGIQDRSGGKNCFSVYTCVRQRRYFGVICRLCRRLDR